MSEQVHHNEKDDPDLTPAERRRLRVRETILDAAERVFAHEGEAGLSIRRLADEIDYSPAAIYKYFKSKADLVEELKEAFFERFLVRMERVLESGGPFLDSAVEGIATYIRTAIERPHHYMAAFSGQSVESEGPMATPEKTEDFLQSSAGKAFQYLEGMVSEGMRDGYFDASITSMLAAKSAWASCHGLSMLMIHLPCYPNMYGTTTAEERDEFIVQHARLMVAGLQKGLSEWPIEANNTKK